MFEYSLPKEKIAQYPVEPADSCKLIIYNRQANKITDELFLNLPNYVANNYVFVFNNTKVCPVRIDYTLDNGKEGDLIIYSVINNREVVILTQLKKTKLPIQILANKTKLGTITEKTEFGYKLILEDNFDQIIEKHGTMPIPPYLKRKSEDRDFRWYQPIFAKDGFSIASPTASLHFTQRVVSKLQEKNIEFIFLKLDVSFSTIYERHRIPPALSSEYYEIDETEYEKLIYAKKKDKKIIAVGTTVCKALETIAKTGQLRGNSQLFIEPPFQFALTDGIITNFHMSKSPTLSLICAFLETEKTKLLYKHALENNYRFLSYGDAMFIF